MLRVRPGKRWQGLVICIGLLVLTACGTTPAAKGSGGVGGSTAKVAVVNGQVITKGDLERRLSLFKLAQPGQATQLNSPTVQKEVLQELVDETLVLQAARQAHISAPSTQVASDFQSFQSQFVPGVYPSEAKFQSALKRLGLTKGDLRAYVASSDTISLYLRREVHVPPVTDQEVSRWYDSHKAELAGAPEYHLRHILVKSKALAEEILKKLHQGESFSTLAKEYSIDKASAIKGGDLGWAPLSQYVPAFAEAAAKLKKVGQVSGIVQSPYGYHIIELLGIRPGNLPALATVAPQIRSYLQGQAQQDAVHALLAKLRAKAKVQIYPVPKA